MGIAQRIAGAAPLPASYPALRWDKAILPGTLFFVDLTNTQDPVVGVPGNGARIPNLARRELARLINAQTPGSYAPGADLSSLDCSLAIGAGFTGVKGKLERSAKGGLHGIISPTTNDGTAVAKLQAPPALKSYFLSRINAGGTLDRFAFFMEVAFTRTGANGKRIVQVGVAGNGSLFMNGPSDAISGSLGTTQNPSFQTVAPADPTTGLTPTLRGAGFSIYPGTPPTAANLRIQLGWGDQGETGTILDFPSYVLYRAMLIDLTQVQAGGMSYADAATLVAEQWQRHATVVNGVTGKYAGDTVPTNPSALP